MNAPDTKISIGIDFGTQSSRVAVFHDGKVKIIPNPEGNKITPSVVAFKKSERLVGGNALKQGAMNPKNTIFNCKRLIGRILEDPGLKADIQNLSLTFSSESNSTPTVEVEYEGQLQKFALEEICAMILHKMKDSVEIYLKHRVQNAVITVPAFFNSGQRQAILDAAQIAGLNVLRLINEPTAAALAYGFNRKSSDEKRIIIIDIGAGTFDVSIIEVTPGTVYKVNSSSGDTSLGGIDFDEKLVEHFAREIHTTKGVDLNGDKRAMRRLRRACEEVKKQLSGALEAQIPVDSLFNDNDYNLKINRTVFEDLCKDLFTRIIDPIETAIREARISKQHIDEVVLIGGSTRVPKIRKILECYFEGMTFNKSINPDEAVVQGAAIMAEVESRKNDESFRRVLIEDVTPWSINARTVAEKYDVFIANTRIPIEKQRSLFVPENIESNIRVEVGKEGREQSNNILAVKIRSERRVDVVFKIDKNGILTVGSSDGLLRFRFDGKIPLSEQDMCRMIRGAELYRQKDETQIKRITLLNSLQTCLSQMRECININENSALSSSTSHGIEKLKKKNEACHQWLENNQNASETDLTAKFEQMKTILEEYIASKKPGSKAQSQTVGMEIAIPKMKSEGQYSMSFQNKPEPVNAHDRNASQLSISHYQSSSKQNYGAVSHYQKPHEPYYELRDNLWRYLDKVRVEFLDKYNSRLHWNQNFKDIKEQWSSEYEWIKENWYSSESSFVGKLKTLSDKWDPIILCLREQTASNAVTY